MTIIAPASGTSSPARRRPSRLARLVCRSRWAAWRSACSRSRSVPTSRTCTTRVRPGSAGSAPLVVHSVSRHRPKPSRRRTAMLSAPAGAGGTIRAVRNACTASAWSGWTSGGRGPPEHVLVGQAELAGRGRRLPAHRQVGVQDHRHVGRAEHQAAQPVALVGEVVGVPAQGDRRGPLAGRHGQRARWRRRIDRHGVDAAAVDQVIDGDQRRPEDRQREQREGHRRLAAGGRDRARVGMHPDRRRTRAGRRPR